MKKTRNLIISLLLVTTLVVGIGYASLVDELLVKGDAQYALGTANDEFDEDVYFEKVEHNGYCKAALDAQDADKDTVIVHIGGSDGGAELSTPEQSAVITCTVKNLYESAVDIENVLNVSDPALADFFAKYSVNINVDGAQNIESGETGTVVVTITPKMVFTSDHAAIAFELPLNAVLSQVNP